MMAMKEIDEAAFLEDLKSFRWQLYQYKDSKEIIKCLSRYYFRKYNFKHFAEEIIIAGYDLQNLNGDIRTEVYLHIPYASYVELPSIREKEDQLWSLSRLFICLIYGNETYLMKGLELVAEKRPHDLLLWIGCIGFTYWQLENWLGPKSRQAFETVKRSSLCDGIEMYENHFDYWRGKLYRNIVEVIEAVLPEYKFENKKFLQNFDRDECLDILIDWDVNAPTEFHCGHTALYYAVAHNNVNAIFKLLKNGAFLGLATDLFNPSLCGVDSKMLEKYFDSCINKCVEDGRFIEIDFKNLISPPIEGKQCNSPYFDEMKVFEIMSMSNEYKHLLTHPVCTTFVFLKWNRLSCALYIDFILYALATVSTIGYILAIFNDVSTRFMTIMTVITVIFNIYVFCRRIVRQIFGSLVMERTTQRKLRDVVLCSNAILIVILLAAINISEWNRCVLSTICILLMTSELFVMAGSICWSFSKYYVMFLDVAFNSLQSLQLCAILIPAFSVSFYLLFRHDTTTIPKPENSSAAGIEEFNKSFNRLSSTIIKTIAMASGEFDTENSNFGSSIFGSYLFIGFLFLISTVFMNLMNALAVSDCGKIQSDAEATRMTQRVRTLAIYARIRSSLNHWLSQEFHDTWIMKIIENCMDISALKTLRNPLNSKIYIGPDNRILIMRPDWHTVAERSIIFEQNGSYVNDWFSYFSYSKKYYQVCPHIVRSARKILERKHTVQHEENAKKRLREQVFKLQNDTDKIIQIVQQIGQRAENTANQLDTIMNQVNTLSKRKNNLKV